MVLDEIDKSSPVPRYYQLNQILMRRIKKMGIGERLPSVYQLRMQFQVSQATIDKAISMLVKTDAVNCEVGRGIFVKNPEGIYNGEGSEKTYLLGIVVPRISGSCFGEIVEKIERTARVKKYHALLCNTYNKVSEEKEHSRSLEQRKVDGIIIAPTHLTKSIDNIKSLQKHKIPFVLLGHINNLDAHCVCDDGAAGARKAVTHLTKLGHKRIAFIGSSFDTAFPDRFQGYKNALAEHRIKFEADLVKLNPSNQTRNILKSVKILLSLKDKPTAIFAINDITAIGIIKVLQKLKKKVPEDIALVGYDDSAIASSSEPSLTTIALPGSEIGQRAAEILIDEIEGKSSNGCNRVLVEPKLVIRKSSGGKKIEEI